MRNLLKFLGALVALTMAAGVGLALLVALDDRPLVPRARTLSAAERAWAADWITNAARQTASVTLTEAQANLLGAYLIDRLAPGRVAVAFAPARARLALSLGLPWSPRERFLNAEFDLRTDAGRPRIARARLAGLPIPAGVAQALAERLLGAGDQAGPIRQVHITPQWALISCARGPRALADLIGGLAPAAERDRLPFYRSLLSAPDARRPQARQVELADLLALVLRAAARGGGADPVIENRAALLALAAYVNQGADPGAARPGAADAAPGARVELRGRHDLAQHFATSAALAAVGGGALADLAGFLKEAADSRHGSGFSFVDLAADRAGTRLGRLAVASPTAAQALQAAAARGLCDADLMPDTAGLPEGLNAGAFGAAYHDTDSPAYLRITELIERRLDRLPLFR